MIDYVYFLFAMLPIIVMNGVAAYRRNFTADLLLGLFLLLARYVPNVAKRSIPIHFMFSSMVGFSRSADRMTLFTV